MPRRSRRTKTLGMLAECGPMRHRLTMSAVDVLLDGPRAQRAFLLRAVFDGAWSVTVEDRAPLTVVVLARGTAWLEGASGGQLLQAGQVVLARGPQPYTLSDAPGRPQDIRVLPGQRCVDPQGVLLAESMRVGVRTWGNTRSPDATVMLIGTYERETSVGALLLASLPPVLVLPGVEHAAVDLLTAELVRDAPGQQVVLDRTLDVVLVSALRRVLAGADRTAPAPDDVVRRALAAMEEHPEHPWTVAGLAAHVGLSRAALARRFTRQVGVPPLAHLTAWRLALAADLLVGTDLTLAAIAARVGYAGPFALSAAFKRVHGVSPTRYRLENRSAAYPEALTARS